MTAMSRHISGPLLYENELAGMGRQIQTVHQRILRLTHLTHLTSARKSLAGSAASATLT